MKRVRMLVDALVDGLQYRCSQVVDFPDAIGNQLVKDGAADAAKAAIDYCLDELKAKPMQHEAEAERIAKAEVTALQNELNELRAQAKAEKDAAKRKDLHDRAAAVAEKLKKG